MEAKKTHEFADAFPMLSDKELDVLAADIKANGLIDPICTVGGKIVDGRNRYAACLKAGVKPVFVQIDDLGDDILGFIKSKNLIRRQMSQSEMSVAAAKIHLLEKREKGEDATPLTQLAESAKVSRNILNQAVVVMTEGTEEQIEQVEQGKKKVYAMFNEIRGKAASKPRKPKAAKPAPDEPATESKDAEPGEDLDLPPETAANFCSTINKMTREIDAMVAKLEALGSNPFGRELHMPTIRDNLRQARKALWINRPSESCPYCKGTGRTAKNPCSGCGTTGSVSRTTYLQACKALGIKPNEQPTPIEGEQDAD